MQSVNTTVTGKFTIDIQCWFIHGSDARGCKVVLVSEYKNEVVIIERNNANAISASGTFNLTYPVSCYSRVLAFDVEHNYSLSNLSIEGNLQPTLTLNTKLCSGISSNFSIMLINIMEGFSFTLQLRIQIILPLVCTQLWFRFSC